MRRCCRCCGRRPHSDGGTGRLHPCTLDRDACERSGEEIRLDSLREVSRPGPLEELGEPSPQRAQGPVEQRSLLLSIVLDHGIRRAEWIEEVIVGRVVEAVETQVLGSVASSKDVETEAIFFDRTVESRRRPIVELRPRIGAVVGEDHGLVEMAVLDTEGHGARGDARRVLLEGGNREGPVADRHDRVVGEPRQPDKLGAGAPEFPTRDAGDGAKRVRCGPRADSGHGGRFMKIIKGFAVAVLVYVAIVVAFESMIGVIQPQAGSTLVLTTLGEDGSAHDRVVSRLQSGGQLYVAANHWPRAWYERLLAKSQVRASIDGTTGDYQAVAVEAGGEEHERVANDNPVPGWFRFVTGFPPRYFVRLELRV